MTDTVVLYNRTTWVRCDSCGADHFITASARVPQSESRWDQLLVEQLRLLGWRAGIEPSGHHQRSPRDICPNCVAGGT